MELPVEKKKIWPYVLLVIVGVIAYFVWRKFAGSAAPAEDQTSGTQIINTGSNDPAPYTPVSHTYAPIPIGANVVSDTGAPPKTVPGISPSAVALPTASVHALTLDDVAMPTYHGPANSGLPSTTPASIDLPPLSNSPPTSHDTLSGDASIVDSAYMALFGRHAEAAGLAYWSDQIKLGNVTSDNLVQKLTAGAQNSDVGSEVMLHPEYVTAYRK